MLNALPLCKRVSEWLSGYNRRLLSFVDGVLTPTAQMRRRKRDAIDEKRDRERTDA